MSVSDHLLHIRALVMDIDGVLTDGSFTWSSDGVESKTFSFQDVMGLSRARASGIVLGLISGEEGPIVERLATKIEAVFVEAGCKDKARALSQFSTTSKIPLANIAYIGDDVNDLGALALAGVSATVASAPTSVQEAVSLVLKKPAGRGAVRELVEMLIDAQQ